MATSFHCFLLLPLELRQRVWELSMEPRRVPVGDFSCSVSDTATPSPLVPPAALLQACAESRSYLERYYVQGFATESPSRYTWINFDIDTVCTRQRMMLQFPAELLSIRYLSIETDDSSFYYDNLLEKVAAMPLLEDLEMRPTRAWGYDWWRDWGLMMREYHFADASMKHMGKYLWCGAREPVRFRTTIINPLPDHEVPEINPDNYFKAERDNEERSNPDDPNNFDSFFELCDEEWVPSFA